MKVSTRPNDRCQSGAASGNHHNCFHLGKVEDLSRDKSETSQAQVTLNFNMRSVSDRSQSKRRSHDDCIIHQSINLNVDRANIRRGTPRSSVPPDKDRACTLAELNQNQGCG